MLLNYDKETNRISFRQYGISATPSGVSKSVKTLVGKRKIPDLSKYEDVAEFLTKSGYGSVSCILSYVADSRLTGVHTLGNSRCLCLDLLPYAESMVMSTIAID